jgi:FkbM family methyltransferase
MPRLDKLYIGIFVEWRLKSVIKTVCRGGVHIYCSSRMKIIEDSSVDYRNKLQLLSLLPRLFRQAIVERYYRREVETTGEAELLHLGKLVNRGELALDIGCNLGVYSYVLSRLSGRVIAFEPNPTLAKFVRSVARTGVDVREIALSSEDRTAELSIPLDPAQGHGWASIVPDFVKGPTEKYSVATRRLDGMNLDRISFMKIDVEGAERMVLDGAKETIARDLPILLIEIGVDDLESTASRLTPLGYSVSFFRKGVWHPIDEFDTRFQSMDQYREDMKKSPTRREIDFINNFLFLPPNKKVSELN